jgi:hypothetical protein
VRCGTCHGRGEVTCGTCDGARNLLHFLRLTVAWRNKVDEQVLERTDLPDKLVRNATGVVALQEQEARLEPTPGTGVSAGAFRGAPVRVNAEVDAAANRLLHGYQLPGGAKLLKQRLTVRSVPVYEARYAWGRETRRFWVYGLERRIHAPRYPLSRARIGAIAGGVATVLGGSVAVFVAAAGGRTPAPILPPEPAPVVPVFAVEDAGALDADTTAGRREGQDAGIAQASVRTRRHRQR